MFKLDKLLLFLLICVCLVVTVVLLDAAIGPSNLISTVYARLNDTVEPVQEEIFLPELVETEIEMLPEVLEVGDVLETGEGIPVLAETGWDIFTSKGFAFEIQYPKQVVQKSILNQDAVNSGIGLAPKAPVWQFRVDDPQYYQGTNLIDASLLIHVLEGQDQESQCLSFKQGSVYQTPNQQRDSLIEVDINGIPFTKDEVIEGVMGEFYKRISYRTFTKGACYELTQLMHYRNIDGLVDKNITEFDQTKVVAELDQVLNTFSLLDIEPTFPTISYPEPKTITSAISKSASEYVDGLDVSHWQGTINWGKVAGAGYIFTFAKGTEGVGWTDSKFIYNMESGQDAGIQMGVYHFARPDSGNSAAAEANYFLSVAGDYLKSGYLRPVLDLEVGTSLGKVALSNWVLEWMETVKKRTGIEPLIYTNLNYVNNFLTDAVTEYDLWIAYWSCEPEPTYTIPPTGKWRDWAFWQYYGPGGCGGNAGFVPGITTNIDLNIFNGVEEGLQEYDAYSHLWVSLTSDAYLKPAPYYADITANVNGDTTGPINFAFWWDCAALEADISAVEGVCGVLPKPPAGGCVKNSIGQQCLGVSNELQLAEHTYQEVGGYTAKVIVKRGGAAPVEDRYKISTYNAIRKITTDPNSPAVGSVDSPFALKGTVEVHSTVAGVLQISLEDPVTGVVKAADCMGVEHDDQAIKNYSLSLSESKVGKIVYRISTRYRPGGNCPIVDQHVDDLSQLYTIDWINDRPLLEITDELGNPLLSGTTIDLGEVEPFQTIVMDFEVSNPSETTNFEVASVVFDNLVNVSDLLVSPEVPYSVGPGETVPVRLSFDILTTGPISFKIAVDHNAINPSPFNLTVSGTARLANNPLQTISSTPVSPGVGQVDDPYQLQLEVDLDAPAAGVIGVSLVDSGGTPVSSDLCLEITESGLSSHLYEYSISESAAGVQDYSIWARYRALGTCPIIDVQTDDLSQLYQIEWLEDNTDLELQDTTFNEIENGGISDLGDQDAFQTIVSEYLIINSSPTVSFEVTGVQFKNLVNVLNPQVDPQGPFTVNPGEQKYITISFDLETLGVFSAVASLDHTASNLSPYTFSLQGTGVLTQNPLQSISPVPGSPGVNLIGNNYNLQVDVDLTPPISGALRVGLADDGEDLIVESDCLELSVPGPISKTANLSWVENDAGLKNYTIQAHYHVGDNCQQGEAYISDLAISYQVEWQEENPILEVKDSDGNLLPDGGTLNLGQFDYYQTVNSKYKLHNTSTTNSLSITGLSVENLTNLGQVNLNPTGQTEIGPGGSIDLEITFLVGNTGDFSFDLVIDHQAGNPTPYQLSFKGSGIMTENPIKFAIPMPVSPASLLIDAPFNLRVDVGIDAPDAGTLQVSMIEKGTEVTSSQQCLVLDDNLNQARTFNLNWTRSIPGIQDYILLTRYRSQGSCPIVDSSKFDLSQTYSVNWEEDSPELEVRDQSYALVTQGSSLDLGQKEFYQEVQLNYTLINTSTTSNLEINAIKIENLLNLDQVNINPAGSINLGPESEQKLMISFLVSEQGFFGFDLVINHEAANPSPFRIGFSGNGVLSNNPIVSLETVPQSPGSSLVSDSYQIQILSELDPPAPGILEISLEDQIHGLVVDPVCLDVSAGELSVHTADFSWEESVSGRQDYLIRAKYKAGVSCPLVGTPDAELTEPYQVSWQILSPVLIVNRPEGVTIFDGAIDYIGEHDFFRFVEVTYVIDNDTDASPLIVENIQIENLVNIREVLIEPALPFEVAPGGSQVVKIRFQVLMLESYSFDLIWEHNGSNPSPHQTSILGDANLNLGEIPVESWLYKFLENIIRSGFFLKLPIFGLFVLRRKKK